MATLLTKPDAPVTPPALGGGSDGGSNNGGQFKPKNAPSSLFDPKIIKRAFGESFIKLDPRTVAKKPGHVCCRGRQRTDNVLLDS